MNEEAEESFEKRFQSLETRIKAQKSSGLHRPIEWPPSDAKLLKKWLCGGLACMVIETPGGTPCGYVRVPDGHPDERKHYDDVDVDVHGGLTFRCKAKEGGSWFGFDCAHYGDFLPLLPRLGGRRWSLSDVRKETERLAEQLGKRS